MFIVNFRCLLLTTVSTCFGHHYAHHQENKDRVLLHMVFALVVLDVAGCSCGALRCGVRAVDLPLLKHIYFLSSTLLTAFRQDAKCLNLISKTQTLVSAHLHVTWHHF